MKIDSKELKFALLGLAIILSWFIWFRPIVAAPLSEMHPFLAMLIYNSGLFFGLYLLSSPLNGSRVKWKASLITFVVILGVDILYAPYLVNTDGTILTSNPLWYVATDAGFGSLYLEFLPQSFVWFAVYIITSSILIFAIPIILLAPRQVARMFGH